MPMIHVNFLAVVVAAVLNMILGAIWYSPAVYGKTWMALVGKRAEDMRSGAGRGYVLGFIAALILAYVLASVIGIAQAKGILQGARVGFWMWIGFVATTSAGDVLWAGRPAKLYFINTGYNLAALIVMGALLAAWR